MTGDHNNYGHDPCPECGSERCEWVGTDDTRDAWECRDCGYEQLIPIPSPRKAPELGILAR
jgi:ribosomal protein L37AE/L43A